jgi:hypothetical protein
MVRRDKPHARSGKRALMRVPVPGIDASEPSAQPPRSSRSLFAGADTVPSVMAVTDEQPEEARRAA